MGLSHRDAERLWVDLRRLGLHHGLVGIGVTDTSPFTDVREEMERRLGEGLTGSLTFTFRDPQRATDVTKSIPWGRRIVVGAASYVPESGGPGPAQTALGRIARFSVDDYYPLVRLPLERIASQLERDGFRTQVLVDDNRLVDRAAAVRAGVGWWGKSTMVLTPGYGPWILLGSVVTDARLPTTSAMRRGCGTCTACLPACPTGALISPGVLDANLCLAYWLQAPGVIPRDLRGLQGDRIYGCDDCLEACPPGFRALEKPSSKNPAGRVDLVELLSISDAELLSRYHRFYIPDNEPRFVRRNALVALGNTGTPDHLDLLSSYLGSDDWLLRVHAAWAIGQIGGGRAGRLLAGRLDREGDERVLGELREAQDALVFKA